MFKNYIKTAYRCLVKKRLYTGINIFGLAIGLASCILIGLYIANELSYDKFNVNAQKIVRATIEYSSAGTVNKIAYTGTKPGPEFKRVFPSVAEFTRTFIGHSIIQNGNKIFEEPHVLYADSTFFNIFSFHIIEGNAATALDAPDKIVLTKSMAKKYFGTTNVVGKTITSGGTMYRISAVCDDVPQNSQIQFDFATRFANLGKSVKTETWWTANWITYFLLNNKNDIGPLQNQVNNYMESKQVRQEAGLSGKDYLHYHLEPLTKVHLYSVLPGFEPNGSIKNVYMVSVIALLILIIAIANYTNLTTAQATGRSAEIGMRKVLGASKRQVFVQFMSESLFSTVASALLAILLASFMIPYFNQITGGNYHLATLLHPLAILSLLAFILLVSFIAGVYPALVLSATQVMGILKKGSNFTGRNNLLRKSLIVGQFGISVFLIIYTIVILQQMHFMQAKDLGYEKKHIIVLPIGGKMLQDFQDLKNAFLQVPGVQSVTASYETPEDVGWGDGITATDEKGWHDVSLNAMPVDLDFTKTLGMHIVAGRDFQQSDFGMMDTLNRAAHYRQPFIINETLAQKIGWTPQQAIGKTISKGDENGPVVGVVKDFNFTSLHNPIGPLVMMLSREFSKDFILRIDGKNMKATIANLQKVWNERIPGRPFTYHFLDDDYNKLYTAEERTSLLFSIASGLAIVLACLGLFGLAAFTTLQKTKEIGIRKVLGANVTSITFLVSKSFLSLVVIAILIAAPVAWWAGNKWLQDFAFRIPVHWYIFVATAIVTVLIALCTVGYHSIKASLANPVDSLRTE